MLTTYHQVNDRLLALSFEEIEGDITPVWIDLFSPTYEEKKKVEELFSLEIPTQEEVEEIETTSRLYEESEAYFMTILLFERSLETLTELTFILKNNTLITLRYDEPTAFRTFTKWITNRPSIPIGDGISVMLGLIEKSIGRLADILQYFAAGIEELSNEIFVEQKIQNYEICLRTIGKQQLTVSNAKESLVSMSLLTGYLSSRKKEFKRNIITRLSNLQLDTSALNEQTVFLGHKISFLLDASFGFLNVEQTKIIKIFSVAAVMFLPPTLIASIYGMNFKDIPELNWVMGYPFALILIVLSSLFPFFYFRKKGWF